MPARFATLDDIPRCVHLSMQMHALCQFASFPFNSEKIITSFARALHSDDWLFAVVEHDGEVVGFAVASVNSLLWADGTESWDKAIYIENAHRNLGLGAQLIEGYINWARSKQVTMINLGVRAGVDDERAREVIEGFGFRFAGASYMLKGGA